MSLMQSKLLGLPVEVAEMIVNWIYRSRDLLSLALSNSRFYRLIVPDHLHYRHVEFCIFDYTMWKYLLEDPSRLKRIETIKLSAHIKPRVPSIMNPSGNQLCTPDEAEKVDSDLLHNALKGMRLLHAVIWDSDDAFLHRTAHIMNLQRNVWEAINRYCPTVRKIDSRGSYSCLRSWIGSDGKASLPLVTPSQITTLTYQAKCYCWSWTEHRSISFLSLFQGLQHLTLLRASSFAGIILDILSMKFPLLESLTLNGRLEIPIESVLEFLAAHPLLRTLEFSALGGAFSENPSNTSAIAACTVTPRLEILHSPRNLVQALFQTSNNESSCHRPLKSLCTAFPLDTQDPPEDLDILSSIGAQLEELTVGEKFEAVQWRCPDLSSPLLIISSAFPNLRLLDLGSVYITKCSAPSGCTRPKVVGNRF
ncbi:hypothetical protein FS837_009053 [Tulasnella sp. UAMH 9824]|nr:hypothetical protein FS837_009053 [Tulasnella sp. UAMH 9824]